MKIEIKKNVLLAQYTSWMVGGPAEEFCLPSSVSELIEAIEYAKSKKMKVTIVGGGSNILVDDVGVRGLVICMRKLKGVETVDGEKTFRMKALAGTPKGYLLREFILRKLEPALFLAGLPGDVGGGIVMNAGVGENIRPREFCEIVEWVDVLGDGVVKRFSGEEIKWTYRHSRGWQPGVVVEAGFRWPNNPIPDMADRVREANRIRLTRQPLDLPSCGSVFVNPGGQKSGALIESCGLKGFAIGGAQVSTKHANFIVNTGGATAADIKAVITQVQKTVKEKTGTELHTEVVFL